jgi:SAM-dependent methyltransferase
MLNKKLEDIGLNEIEGGVDLLSLFQVVEHVPAPVEFVKAASRLIRPGGYMAIAVPNEYRGFGLLRYDPANWPPHHVTRWRKKDLSRLANVAGLRVAARGGDVLYGPMIERFITSHNELSAAIGLRGYPVGKRFGRTVSFLYRKLGCKYFFPRLGLSIYVIVQK